MNTNEIHKRLTQLQKENKEDTFEYMQLCDLMVEREYQARGLL